MSRGLSAAAKAELYAAHTSGLWLTLVTVEHPDITTVRLVNDVESVVSGGDTYSPAAFSAKLPPDRDGPAAAILVLDNVDRAMVQAVRSITTPASVTVEVIRKSDPSTILVSYPELEMSSAVISASTIELSLTPDAALDESYPGTAFTPLLFPAGFAK